MLLVNCCILSPEFLPVRSLIHLFKPDPDLHHERVAGKFSRSFYLPQTVKHDGIKATYRDGILEVQVPKADEAKPRQIAISLN